MPKTIQFTCLPGNRYATSKSQELYLYAELKGIEAAPKEGRQPLNISLVIDRSGSMRGDKIAYVKEAVKFIIQNLKPEDYLSIIIYDTLVELLVPAAPVSNKTHLVQLVDTITARNMTNLSGGMLEGYKQVESGPKEGYVNRVLLLTDGLANRGITHPEQLQMLAEKHFREKGIGLSTFGVGADFNESLLTNLSEYGGANYYFIDSSDKIPEIFAEELKGLLAVVAQNTELQIHFDSEQLKALKVYGFPATIEAGQVRIAFNDIHSLEEKAILLALQSSNIQTDLHYQAELSYTDVIESMEPVTQKESVEVKLMQEAKDMEGGVETKAFENITLFLATDYYERAVEALNVRDMDKAKALSNKALGYIELYTGSYGWTPELKTLNERITAFMDRIKDYRNMSDFEQRHHIKTSSYHAYLSRKKKPF